MSIQAGIRKFFVFLKKKIFFLGIIGFGIVFWILGCNNETVTVDIETQPQAETQPQTETQSQTPPQNPAPTKPVPAYPFIYRSDFVPTNASRYKNLLEICKRCGQTVVTGNYVETQIFSLDSFDSKKCSSWANKGHIQIAFKEKKLPTETELTLWPILDHRSCLGMPFSVKGTAEASNEDQGFQIRFKKDSGIQSAYSFNIESDYSNHVKDTQLQIKVFFGEQQIISARLAKSLNSGFLDQSTACGTYSISCIQTLP